MSNPRTIEPLRLADQFRALGNVHRLEIFLFLASNCAPNTMTTDDRITACVGDLASLLTIAPSTVSHHLKELRQAGLIRMDRRGQSVECWVDTETVRELASFFQEVCSAPGC
ncbi:MAG: ArsR/SmtB family transcription factor [Tepidiformaceae bacterium]